MKVTAREKGETRRGERKMRDYSYSIFDTDFTIVEFVVDFVTVAALTHLHVSLPPFHLSYATVKCFKAMSSMLFVVI